MRTEIDWAVFKTLSRSVATRTAVLRQFRDWHPDFDHRYDPATPALRRVKAGMTVTQMHYDKQGLITPEMKFIVIRVNGKLQDMLVAPAIQNCYGAIHGRKV